MAESERIEHLKLVRAEMVERRIFYAGRLIENDAAENEEVFQLVASSLINTQQVIQILDQALDEERKPQGSVYETRGLMGA